METMDQKSQNFAQRTALGYYEAKQNFIKIGLVVFEIWAAKVLKELVAQTVDGTVYFQDKSRDFYLS